MSLILRILAIIAGVAAVVGWFLVQGKLDEKDQELAAARQTTQSAQSELSEIQNEISTLENQLRSRESDLADEKSRSSRLNTQLLQARRDVNQYQQETTEAKDKVSSLEANVRQLRTELVSVRTRVPGEDEQEENDEAVELVKELNTELEKAESKISNLESELRAARRAVAESSTTTTRTPASRADGRTAQRSTRESRSQSPELPTADGSPALSPQQTASGTAGEMTDIAPAPGGLRTSVTSINRNAGLLALAAGSGAGLQSGQTVILRDGLTDLAVVQISDVREQVSVARILPESRNAKQLKAGRVIEIVQ